MSQIDDITLLAINFGLQGYTVSYFVQPLLYIVLMEYANHFILDFLNYV